MAIIIAADGSKKYVKNLGWLLAHYADVERFVVMSRHNAWHLLDAADQPDADACLVAYLSDGRRYVTSYGSYNVLVDFLHRPVFYGLPLLWRGIKSVITKR